MTIKVVNVTFVILLVSLYEAVVYYYVTLPIVGKRIQALCIYLRGWEAAI